MTTLRKSRLVTLFFGIALITAGVTLYSVGINMADAYFLSFVMSFFVSGVVYARNRPDTEDGKTIFQNLAEV